MDNHDYEITSGGEYALQPHEDLGLRPEMAFRKESNPKNWRQVVNAKRKDARTVFLTQRVVDRVQPQAKEFTVYHKSIPGFGMRVRPSGHKSFILLYKLSGRGGKYLIGNAAAMSLDKAQDKAVEILQKIRDGEDPTAEKRQNTSLLFGAVFKEYMQDWGSNFTPKWRKESEQIFQKYVEGLFPVSTNWTKWYELLR